MIRHFRDIASEPHEKLPESSLRALNFLFPPLTRTSWILFGPIFVFAACLPNSNFLFLRNCARFAPVAERLCLESLEIPLVC